MVCGAGGADTLNGAGDIFLYRAPGEGGDTVVALGAAKFGFQTGQFGYSATTQIVDGLNFFDAGTSHAASNQACWYVEGNALMYDSDGTTGGHAAVTIATGADVAGLSVSGIAIVDDAGQIV
ncbi:MAG: hypothetical protein A2051_12350 [Desulfovibrionales bacterium GWA2_65_9]|nr:MAG: hypothetical protein A2051_12350 [Desulfovibrionales bacterium GWA2_65_9]